MIVKRGISGLQVDQLIKFTGKDELIEKFTHDSHRFKNPSNYKKWQKGKTIYTLIDKKGNLLGVIWFGKKKNPQVPDYPYTFAIRVYPPTRGKGHALKFMKEAFKNFKPNGVWLTTHIENIPAIKLYKKFGFKELACKADELTMAL